MELNFKEALAAVSRALPAVLFRALVFVAGGFAVILLFGMLLFASRQAGDTGSVMIIGLFVMILCGGFVTVRMLQRFFLYRQRAAMLFLFSGSPNMSASLREVARIFPAYPAWVILNRRISRAITVHSHGHGEGMTGLPASGVLSQAILALAFSRNGPDISLSAREGLALFLRHGDKTRRLTRRWLWASFHCLAFLFICLALSNWFFFSSAGVPVWIGLVLAAAIAWLLHQAFLVPFALAGITGTLLAETKGHEPDVALCEKIAPLLTR